ncbi:MAG: PTS transporter subunit EIIC [Defluviitaleaceae bacterium]|nr:PTS transporter subunit EIIC [Defluviitaleaceae bacterium]
MQPSKLQEIMLKASSFIQNNLYIKSISGGLMSLMPVLIIGAIFSLINGLPLDAYQEFLVSTGLKPFVELPVIFTNNMLALYASFAIAFRLTNELGKDGFSAGVLSMLSFLIVTPLGVAEGGGVAIMQQWLGATGFFAAMLVAVFVGRMFCVILDKGLYIRMPAGVPPQIERSFAALVPGFLFVIAALIINAIFAATQFVSIHGFIFGFIQTPLTNIGASPIAYILVVFLIHLLWWFGIHGVIVLGVGVMMPILTPLGLENLAYFQEGLTPPNVIIWGSITLVLMGGSGTTLGLVIAMLRAKAARYRTLGRLAIVPGIFGINEPIIFGTPMVLNTKFLVPFLGIPTFTAFMTWLLTIIGILPTLNGFGPPLGTPAVVHGFLMGGWRVAAWQVVLSLFHFLVIMRISKKQMQKHTLKNRIRGKPQHRAC